MTAVFLQTEEAEDIMLMEGVTNGMIFIVTALLVTTGDVTHPMLERMAHVITSPSFRVLSVKVGEFTKRFVLFLNHVYPGLFPSFETRLLNVTLVP